MIVRTWFGNGFYGGLGFSLLIGIFLFWLWQPERQIQRHAENLFHAIENKKWERMADFVASDYQDQWGHDRARMLDRAREVFRYLRNVQINASSVSVMIDKDRAHWAGKITIEADQNEVAALIKQRVNTLDTRFDLEWHRLAAKPWDWKLVSVSNQGFEIPTDQGTTASEPSR